MPTPMKQRPIQSFARGILNKLTPEKFQKLSDDLLNVGLTTETVLRGVILLIFDKALDEPKYSSMYAQLCKRLSEEVPNFEPPNGPCTFRILLLNKCRTEFENRAAASEAFERHGAPLTPEEEERRYIAKCKMLGNIKFIGELGKLEILSEAIVHRCIRQLLPRRAPDQQEDLECLVQLIRTCGRVLDSEKGRSLMDQYFLRMEMLSNCRELMPRIRFMLRDVIDLRGDKWVPRKATSTEGPMPIQQIRGDDDHARDGYRPRGGGGNERLRQQGQDSVGGDSLFHSGLKTRGGFVDDMFHSLNNLGSPSANLIHMNNSHHDKYSFGSNGYGNNKGESRDGYRNHQRQGGFNSYNQRQGGGFNKHQNNNNNNNNGNGKELAPRFKKSLVLPTPGSMEDLQMRPAANSLLYKANNLKPQSFPLHPPQSGGLRPNPGERVGSLNDFLPNQSKSSSGQQTGGASSLLKDSPITIKQAQDKTSKAKKDKGPSREEILKRVTGILDDLTAEVITQDDESKEDPMEVALAAYRDLKVPDKIIKDIPFAVLNYALEKQDEQSEKCVGLLVALKKETLVTSASCNEGIRSLALVISQREASTPRIGTAVAQLLTNSMQQGLTTLAEIATLTENGAHYPLFLLVLQQMNKTLGKQPLTEVYNSSKVNLMSLLPASERTKERLAEILEERGLSFLFPLLRIQAELSKQLITDPNPNQFYKWIKENLDASYHTDPGFINALVTVLIKYITQESTLPPGVAVVSPPDKSLADKERSLLDRYVPVIRSFLHQNLHLQLMAIHSLQVFCYSLNFPKGMLLRWFIALYDKEICEEEAFLMWKEDITDTYPGKGLALFQVNNWLTWLQETESDSDESVH